MNKIGMLVIIHFMITSSIIAQDVSPLDYMRGGIGLAFLGSGDMLVGKLEFEYITPINKRVNFGISSNLGYGKYTDIGTNVQGQGTIFQTYTVHVDPNIYLRTISVGNFHFHTGLGASLMFVNDLQANVFPNRETSNSEDPRFSIGGNIVFQFNYDLNENTALAWRVLTQPYINGDISTGMSFNLIKTFNWKTDE